MEPSHALGHAREIIAAHRAGKAPPAAALAWIAAGFELNLYVGIDLPLALGLAGASGRRDDVAERRRQRDILLREVARRWYPELCPAAAAAAIVAAVARQARARGRQSDDQARALAVLAAFNPPLPTGRQIRRILAIHPVAMASARR